MKGPLLKWNNSLASVGVHFHRYSTTSAHSNDILTTAASWSPHTHCTNNCCQYTLDY